MKKGCEIMETAFIYARVSTKEQAAKDNSIPAQFNRIEKYCDDNNIKVLKKFFDSESAYNDNKRIQFYSMIDEAIKEYPNYIITDDSSRFSRKKATAVSLKSKLRSNGIGIRYANEPYLDPNTIAGLWNEGIQELMNQSSSMQTSFHVMKGMKYNVQNRDPETGWCFKNGGKPAFGYDAKHIENNTGKRSYKTIWIIDKSKYELIREILLDMRINKKMSYNEIRDELNKRNIKTNRNNQWSTSSIADLFKEHRLYTYAGKYIWNRTNTKSDNSKNKDKDKWIIVDKAHEAIINDEELDLILEYQEHTKKGAPAGKAKGSCFLFTGFNYEQNKMFKCSECGSSMVGDQNHNSNYYKYVCGGHKNKGNTFCDNKIRIDRDWLEEKLIGEIIERYKKPESIDNIINQIDKNINKQNQSVDLKLDNLKSNLKKKDKQIKNLMNSLKEGIEPTLIKEEINKCYNEKQDILNSIDSYKKSYSKESNINKKDLKRFLSNFKTIFDNASKEQRRELIRTFVRYIEFNPVKVEITVEFYDDSTLQSIRYCEPYHK
jgi:hypothetical protein